MYKNFVGHETHIKRKKSMIELRKTMTKEEFY